MGRPEPQGGGVSLQISFSWPEHPQRNIPRSRSRNRKPRKSVKSPFTKFKLRVGLCVCAAVSHISSGYKLTQNWHLCSSEEVLLSLAWYQPTDRKEKFTFWNYLTAVFQHFIFCIFIGPDERSKNGMTQLAGSHTNTSIFQETEGKDKNN